MDFFSHTFTHPFLNSNNLSSIIELLIDVTDANFIKNLTNLATSKNTTFLVIGNLSIQDASGNSVIPIMSSDALPVQQFIHDSHRPSLISYSFNLDNGIISFIFDETIRVTSFNVTELSIQADVTLHDLCNYHFSTATLFVPDLNSVDFMITHPDLNKIKSLPCLATMLSNTYLSIGSRFIQDMNNNYIYPISNSSALRADIFTSDTSNPQLITFDLNLNSAILTLHFDETVNVSSLSLSRLILSNSTNIFQFPFLVLSGGSFETPDSPSVSITLTSYQLDTLKVNKYFATHNNNTFLSIFTTTIRDMSTPPNTVVPDSLQVRVLTLDYSRPRLVMWYPDFDRFSVLLYFSEPIDSSSIVATSISFQSQRVFNINTTANLTLSGGNTSSSDGKLIIVNIPNTDLNSIKGLPLLLSSINDSFITITPSLCRDIAGNEVVEIARSFSLIASNFIRDNVKPRLMNWGLDMDTGILDLSFSETVNFSSVIFSGIGLQSSFNSSESSGIKLTGGLVLNMNHDVVISIEILNSDLNLMKQFGIGR